MAEKIIFEFRRTSGESGFQYEISHPAEGITVKVPGKALKGRPAPMHPAFYWMAGPCGAPGSWKKSRRRMRKTLDFYESMYNELYGDMDEDQSEERD